MDDSVLCDHHTLRGVTCSSQLWLFQQLQAQQGHWHECLLFYKPWYTPVYHCQTLQAKETCHDPWQQSFSLLKLLLLVFSLALFSSSKYFFLNSRTVLSPRPCLKVFLLLNSSGIAVFCSIAVNNCSLFFAERGVKFLLRVPLWVCGPPVHCDCSVSTRWIAALASFVVSPTPVSLAVGRYSLSSSI